MKPTLVAGASPNPERYSFKAVDLLQAYHHTVYAIGLRKGKIGNVSIELLQHNIVHPNVHTVSLYVGLAHQAAWIPYIISHQPTRVIFNPGTENAAFCKLLQANNIECLEACTLVLLRTNQY